MEYVFTATETGTPSGNEAETKALLHMLDATEDGIELFAVDCFNDVTGMDNPCFVLHDAQLPPARLSDDDSARRRYSFHALPIA